MTFYLYVKRHNVTGLKYLGFTHRDPFKYSGSGHYWMKHLKKHGNDVSTEIQGEFTDMATLRAEGKRYSELWNIVSSIEWANLMFETGDGRAVGSKDSESTREKKRRYHIGRKRSDEQRLAMSSAQRGNTSGKGNLGKSKSAEHRSNISKAKKGKPAHNKGVPMSEEQKVKLRGEKVKDSYCERCNKTMNAANFKRWHSHTD